jgi:hypothetical protein
MRSCARPDDSASRNARSVPLPLLAAHRLIVLTVFRLTKYRLTVEIDG